MFSGKMMYFTRIKHDTFTFKGIDLYVNHARLGAATPADENGEHGFLLAVGAER